MKESFQETHVLGFVNVSSNTSSDRDSGSEPVRIRDTRALKALTKALKSADKAWILWTLRGWVAHNQAKKRGYRDGHYWTFRSIESWKEKEFDWLSVKQISTIMAQLVESGLIIRKRRNVHSCYWYRVDETALASLCNSLPSVKSLTSQTAELLSESAEQTSQTADQSAKNAEHKTTIRKQENIKQSESNTQTTTAVQPPADTEIDAVPGSPDVVVVSTPCPTTREAETGELIIEAEVVQNRHDEGPDDEPASVEAEQSQHANDTAPSKVPLKVPADVDLLRAELVRFGVVPGAIPRLVQTYPAADIRYVMAYTRSPEGANIKNPPGFLRDELQHGGAGVLGQRDQKMLKFEHPSTTLSPTRFTAPDGAAFTDDEREEIALIGFDRFMAQRQHNAQFDAEDAALMNESILEHSNHSLDLEHEFA